MYFRRDKYSSNYPPVDTNFVNDVTGNEPSNAQFLGSLVTAAGTFDRQYYGFKSGVYGPMSVKLNGTDTGTTIQWHVGSNTTTYTIPSGTIIYGFSVTPGVINLWTDPQYVDKSQPVMYGRRGLYINPYTDNVYDWTNKESVSIAVMHGIYDYLLVLMKGSFDGQSNVEVRLSVRGFGDEFNAPTPQITPKFALRSEVISTGTVEEEIVKLQREVNSLTDQISNIQTEVDRLIPDLTKLVSSEASRNYVAR